MRVLLLGPLVACASATPALPETPVALRLKDTVHGDFSLGELRGRPVLVTVITTWSDFALLEVPRFKALLQRTPELEIVTIALDENPKMIGIFRETFAIPYRVATVEDPAWFTGRDGPFGEIAIMPTSILLDRAGKPAARMDGMWPPNVLEAAVQKVAGSIGRD